MECESHKDNNNMMFVSCANPHHAHRSPRPRPLLGVPRAGCVRLCLRRQLLQPALQAFEDVAPEVATALARLVRLTAVLVCVCPQHPPLAGVRHVFPKSRDPKHHVPTHIAWVLCKWTACFRSGLADPGIVWVF